MLVVERTEPLPKTERKAGIWTKTAMFMKARGAWLAQYVYASVNAASSGSMTSTLVVLIAALHLIENEAKADCSGLPRGRNDCPGDIRLMAVMLGPGGGAEDAASSNDDMKWGGGRGGQESFS